MSQLDFKLGPKIKAFRRQIGMQANKLASQLEISPSYLALIEGGKRKVDGDLLIKICDELKISAEPRLNSNRVDKDYNKVQDYKSLTEQFKTWHRSYNNYDYLLYEEFLPYL